MSKAPGTHSFNGVMGSVPQSLQSVLPAMSHIHSRICDSGTGTQISAMPLLLASAGETQNHNPGLTLHCQVPSKPVWSQGWNQKSANNQFFPWDLNEVSSLLQCSPRAGIHNQLIFSLSPGTTLELFGDSCVVPRLEQTIQLHNPPEPA